LATVAGRRRLVASSMSTFVRGVWSIVMASVSGRHIHDATHKLLFYR
jgi:hypothetical protein